MKKLVMIGLLGMLGCGSSLPDTQIKAIRMEANDQPANEDADVAVEVQRNIFDCKNAHTDPSTQCRQVVMDSLDRLAYEEVMLVCSDLHAARFPRVIEKRFYQENDNIKLVMTATCWKGKLK